MTKFIKFSKRGSASSNDTADESVTSVTCSSGDFPLRTPPTSPGQTVSEKGCLRALRIFAESSGLSITDQQLFRYAWFHDFQKEPIKNAILEQHDTHHMNLQMRGELLKQFERASLFPLRGLRTKREHSEVVYFRPSSFFPHKHDPALLLDSLCYVFNDLSATEQQCRNGVGVIANLKGFSSHQNYDEEYWLHFMYALQGKLVPTRTSLFLILNPPSWFGKVWKTMKHSMSPDFIKRVHIIDSDSLPDYLEDGYESFLPDDLGGGWRTTSEIVEDFIDRRVYVDKQAVKKKKALHQASFDLLSSLLPPLES